MSKHVILTDKFIKAEMAKLPEGAARRLTDPSERGGGRLVLDLERRPDRVSAKWSVTWYRDSKRHIGYLGDYPDLTLAAARKRFREDLQPKIRKGEDPLWTAHRALQEGKTLQALAELYIRHLGARPSAKIARQVLLGPSGIVHKIGPNLPATAVRKEHILPVLGVIYGRGKAPSANRARNILHAAFNYAIKAGSCYFGEGAGEDWGIEFNPVSSIPSNPDVTRPRERALRKGEVSAFWAWLDQHKGPDRGYVALMVTLATGLRPTEVLQLSTDHLDLDNGLIRWSTTKNRKAHAIPLARQVQALLAELEPSAEGLLFPACRRRAYRTATNALARITRTYIAEAGVQRLEVRDLRRTWKTLTGAAGIRKEIRDRIQNHAISDVSSKHYDMYDYLPEMREGVRIWEDVLDAILASPPERVAGFLTDRQLARLRQAMGPSGWRAAPQARHRSDWIGKPLAFALEEETDGEWSKRVKTITRRLANDGVLSAGTTHDSDRGADVPAYYWAGPELSAEDEPANDIDEISTDLPLFAAIRDRSLPGSDGSRVGR
jgi:integrase